MNQSRVWFSSVFHTVDYDPVMWHLLPSGCFMCMRMRQRLCNENTLEDNLNCYFHIYCVVRRVSEWEIM